MVRVWMLVLIVALLAVASAEANTKRGGSPSVGATALAVADVAVALTQPGAFAAGGHHSLVVLHDGTVWAWGRNHHGQLGDGTTENRTVPVQVAGLTNVRSVAAGGAHSLAILEDGSVWAWGRNTSFEAGDESREDQLTPVPVAGLTGARSIAAGDFFSIAALADGSVWTWGSNAGGQLGVVMLDIRMSMPVQVEELSGVRSVAAGEIFALALLEDGTVWGWGRNQSGQVGSGDSTVQHDRPVEIVGLSEVLSIAAGSEHALAVGGDGSVWAWGFNEHGQLGMETGDEWRLTTPTHLAGFEGALSVAAGADHSFAVTADGRLWAWGRHDFGRLGDGSREHRFAPVEVSAVSGVLAAAGGSIHSVAVMEDGSLWAWGDNRHGQLGDGSTESRPTPARVEGLGGVRLAAADPTVHF